MNEEFLLKLATEGVPFVVCPDGTIYVNSILSTEVVSPENIQVATFKKKEGVNEPIDIGEGLDK